MSGLDFAKMKVAFQGEPGAFSEAAAVQLLGEEIHTVPRPTFEATFRAIADGAADALLLPVENTLAGSVVRVYDLLLHSKLEICGETVLPITHALIGMPGALLSGSFAFDGAGAVRTLFREASYTEASAGGGYRRERAGDDGARRQNVRGDCRFACGETLQSRGAARKYSR
jgi:hypothetical protein